MLKILVKNKQNGKTQSYQLSQNAILIGRQQNCDIMLDSTKISRRHAKLSVQENSLFIEDLGSGNGTVVNNKRIETGQRTVLKKNDTITVEEFEIKINFSGFEELDPDGETASQIKSSEGTDPEIIEVKMIKKVLGALDQEKMPHIIMVSTGYENQRAVFSEGVDEIAVGRDPDCGLSLNSNVVSRRHSVIMVRWGGYVLKDLGSKNGTFVNGERIQEKTLKDGDQITFGTLSAVFRNPLAFDLDGFTKKFKEKKEREATALIQSPKDRPAPQLAMETAATAGKEGPKTDKPGEKKEDKKSLERSRGEREKKEVEEILKDADAEALKKAALDTTSKLTKKYTPTELLLFSFGAVVIVGVIVVLILLFAGF